MEANYFTILWWFLPYIDMNQPWGSMCPPVPNPLHVPPHPSGLSQCTAFECLFHAQSNLDWSSISHAGGDAWGSIGLARRSNQSILKEISPRCSLEGLMLELKLQYFGYLTQTADSLKRPWCWEGFGAGGEGDDRGWDGWMASSTQWKWVWVNFGSWWGTGRPGVLQFMGSQRVRHDWSPYMYITTEKRSWIKTLVWNMHKSVVS